MKAKKLLSLLLAALMVLTILPMTAFAAGMDWKWTVTVIGGYYYRADGTQSKTNSFEIRKELDNSVDNEIGYTFKWNASAGGSNYDGGWQLYSTINGKESACNAYIYTRDMSGASGSWTAPKSSHTGTSSHPFTVYLSDFPARPELTPSAPGASDVERLLSVSVDCVNADVDHPTKSYALNKGLYEIGVVKGTSTYTCDVTIYAEQYVAAYSTDLGVQHSLKDNSSSPKTVTLTYNKSSKAWTSAVSSVAFEVICESPKPEVPPTGPSSDEIKAIIGSLIEVECINPYAAAHSKKSYALIDGSFNVSNVTGDKENGYFVNVTVTPDKYVEQYNIDMGNGHVLSPEGQSASFELKYNAQVEEWAIFSSNGIPFTVDCDAKPALPTDDELKDIFGDSVIGVECLNSYTNHETKIYGLLPGSYTFGDIVDDNVVLTVKPQPYAAKYSSDIGYAHTLTDGSKFPIDFDLHYNIDLGKWELDSRTPVYICVICDLLPEGPTEDDVKRLLGDVVTVDCVNDDVSHDNKVYSLLKNGFSIGKVWIDKELGYFVNVTIMPDAYVKQYNKDTGAEHKLSPSTQGSKVITLSLTMIDDELVWGVYGGDRAIVYTVTCKQDTKPTPRPRPSDDSPLKPTGDLTRRDENPNTGAHSSELLVLTAAFSTLGACTVIAARKKKNEK